MKKCFLDNRHVERLDNVQRVMHQPEKKGPVLKPEEKWEGTVLHLWSPPAFDPREDLYKMWYYAGEGAIPLMARSGDGLIWEKPDFGDGTNTIDLGIEVSRPKENRIVVTRDENDSEYPFKGLTRIQSHIKPLRSKDGITWEPIEDVKMAPTGDEYRLAYDHFEERYVASIKTGGKYPLPELGRCISLSFSDDFKIWSEPQFVLRTDETDQMQGRKRIETVFRDPDVRSPLVNKPEEYRTDIYNMPIFNYEDLYIGFPAIFNQSGIYYVPREARKNVSSNQDGVIYPEVVVSRDLTNWERVGDREPFLPFSPPTSGQKDQSIIFVMPPVVMDDKLMFYYSGRRYSHVKEVILRSFYGDSARREGEIFLATMRLDGFLSLEPGEGGGTVLTKPCKIDGTALHVNADAAQGELRAEILDAETGAPIPGYSLGERYDDIFARMEHDRGEDVSIPVSQDSTDAKVTWRGRSDLSELEGKVVRIRFMLQDAALYSYWFE